jgi:hypothetical protein
MTCGATAGARNRALHTHTPRSAFREPANNRSAGTYKPLIYLTTAEPS